jgi:hypothetical protein
MPVTPSRTFIYGDFSSTLGTSDPVQPVLLGQPVIAIEILREFSPTELVGKVYVKTRGGNWAPVSQPGLKDYDWYREFTKNKSLGFWIDMVYPWEVLYFRTESDDAGPYVAVGLRQSSRR